MAKAQDRQLAQCTELGSYQNAKGETKETAKFCLDGNDAKTWEEPCGKFFKPIAGRYYYPVIDVIPVARYSEAKKKAYNKNQTVIRWHEVE